MGVDIRSNVEAIRRTRVALDALAGGNGTALTSLGLAAISAPRMPWDFKLIAKEFEDFGNFHFGAAAAAAGLALDVPLWGGGITHSDPATAEGTPWSGRPWGDDAKDQAWIAFGYSWFGECH